MLPRGGGPRVLRSLVLQLRSRPLAAGETRSRSHERRLDARIGREREARSAGSAQSSRESRSDPKTTSRYALAHALSDGKDIADSVGTPGTRSVAACVSARRGTESTSHHAQRITQRRQSPSDRAASRSRRALRVDAPLCARVSRRPQARTAGTSWCGSEQHGAEPSRKPAVSWRPLRRLAARSRRGSDRAAAQLKRNPYTKDVFRAVPGRPNPLKSQLRG